MFVFFFFLDKHSVSVVSRTLTVFSYNGERVVGVPVTADVAYLGSKTQKTSDGRSVAVDQYKIIRGNSSSSIVIKNAIPHPSFLLIFVFSAVVNVPIDLETGAADALVHGGVEDSNIACCASENAPTEWHSLRTHTHTLLLGWSTYAPFITHTTADGQENNTSETKEREKDDAQNDALNTLETNGDKKESAVDNKETSTENKEIQADNKETPRETEEEKSALEYEAVGAQDLQSSLARAHSQSDAEDAEAAEMDAEIGFNIVSVDASGVSVPHSSDATACVRLSERILAHWRKKITLFCPDLSIPASLLSQKDPQLVQKMPPSSSVSLFLRTEQTLSVLFAGIAAPFVFDATRGILASSTPITRPFSDLVLSSHAPPVAETSALTHATRSTLFPAHTLHTLPAFAQHAWVSTQHSGLSAAPAETRFELLLLAKHRNMAPLLIGGAHEGELPRHTRTHTQKENEAVLPKSCVPFAERVFPFDVLHPYQIPPASAVLTSPHLPRALTPEEWKEICTAPQTDTQSTDSDENSSSDGCCAHPNAQPFSFPIPAALPLREHSLLLSFKLELASEQEYETLPPYVTPPFSRALFAIRRVKTPSAPAPPTQPQLEEEYEETEESTEEAEEESTPQPYSPAPPTPPPLSPRTQPQQALSLFRPHPPPSLSAHRPSPERLEEKNDGLCSEFLFVFRAFEGDGLTAHSACHAEFPARPLFRTLFYNTAPAWTSVGHLTHTDTDTADTNERLAFIMENETYVFFLLLMYILFFFSVVETICRCLCWLHRLRRLRLLLCVQHRLFRFLWLKSAE